MQLDPNRPETWRTFHPQLIAHDVARSRDYSTAVVGGHSPFEPEVTGIIEARELPQNLVGYQRANALAEVDQKYYNNSIIIADLSNDPSYAEMLFATFGPRVIGLQISRFGDGQDPEHRIFGSRAMLVYTVGRTYLLELLHARFNAGQVALSQGKDVQRAFDQLTKLQLEHRLSGAVYSCAPGQHDDLGISIAMLVWAARHPHLSSWHRSVTDRHRRPKPKQSWLAWT